MTRRLFLICTLALFTSVSVSTAAEPLTIIIFGDSITQGGALPANQKEQLWLTRLQKELNGKVLLINEGKGGRPRLIGISLDVRCWLFVAPHSLLPLFSPVQLLSSSW